jgi:hypothetical protein
MTVQGRTDVAVDRPLLPHGGRSALQENDARAPPQQFVIAAVAPIRATVASAAHILALGGAAKFCEKLPLIASVFRSCCCDNGDHPPVVMFYVGCQSVTVIRCVAATPSPVIAAARY